MLRPAWVKVVAWFELWGGIWGILATTQGLYERAGQLSAGYVAVAVLAFSFFAATAFAGYQLASRHPRGWHLTRLLLPLQVVQFSVAGISYAAYVGAALTAGVSGWVLQTGGEIGSLFRIRLLDADSPFSLSVNFVAVAAILMLKNRGSHSDREGSPAVE
jgi:hypothetical protein